MFMFLKWKELHCGNSFEQFSAIRTALANNNIRHNYKLVNRNDAPPFRSPVRNILGRVGENLDGSTIYYIYVYKSDYESARYVSRDAR